MRLGFLLALSSGLALRAGAADYCNPRDLQGAYGFQLTGETRISGGPKPAVTLGRLDFDGEGGVRGTSSVKYAGLLLGNPVTGTYESHTDCTVSWSLQDDSGAYQHFSGTATPDSRRVRFRQTDAGGARNGVLVQVSKEACAISDLRKKYAFTLSGSIVPMVEEGAPVTVTAKGTMAEKGGSHFQVTIERKAPYTTDIDVSVDSDCTVELGMAFSLEGDDPPVPVNLRGILVDAGKEILAIQTDPGALVSARFTAQ